MKLILIACLCVVSQANFLGDVGHALSGAVHTVGDGVKDVVDTVGDGVKDAAHTVGDGLDTAAHAVGGALTDVGHTLGGTFGDVWNVVKDPLKEAGKEVLIKAGEFALEQGITMALGALAAGKREIPERQAIKTYLSSELIDEYSKWLKDVEKDILSSKDELSTAMSNAKALTDLPTGLRTYVQEYVNAFTKGDTGSFVANQANIALKNAVADLKTRLENRVFNAINTIAAN